MPERGARVMAVAAWGILAPGSLLLSKEVYG